MEQTRIRRRVKVWGHVQGVFFRSSAEESAVGLGVEGWIRNQADGSVEAVFEGESDGVQALVAYCHRGSRWSKVERIEVFEEAPEGISGFEVL
jgi:acylphosphatase